MHIISKIILPAFFVFGFSSVHAQADSVADEEGDCFTHFFESSQRISSPNKIMLVTKPVKILSLAAFLKANASGIEEPQYGLADLDNDGKKELVIYDYTGGAHCCDEFYFFKNIASNKYQYAGKTFAGDVCVTENNQFVFSFYQSFGYFFTCFACAYTDTTATGPQDIEKILLKYSKGKLQVLQGDKELKSQINDNLGKLSEQPYEVLEDEIAQDNGLRKAFALNLAVYYYSFGRNMIETKKLFDKFYKYPDAKEVWKAFLAQLQFIRSENDF